jgi:hypothetical protein
MNTKIITEHFAKKEGNSDVFSSIKLALQSYFVADISQENALNVVKELNEILQIYPYPLVSEHVGDGEIRISSPVEEMYHKLNTLMLLYPKEEYIKEYLDKLMEVYQKTDEFYYYSQEKENFFKYIYDFESFTEIHANLMENYFIKNSIPFHPSLSIFKKFEILVNEVNLNPKKFEKLQNFWKENSKALTTSCDNPNNWTIPELYKSLTTNPEIIENIDKVNNLMIIETRIRIAKGIFQNFLNHPENQDELSDKFPLFFKFASWMKPIDVKKFYYQFEEKHIDILAKYKNRAGYKQYIENSFNINIDEHKNYGLLLHKLAQKASLFTKLFDTHEENNKLFVECYSLSDLLKKIRPTKLDNRTYGFKNYQEKNEQFMKFIAKLIVEAEHDELQKYLPINNGENIKRIKL